MNKDKKIMIVCKMLMFVITLIGITLLNGIEFKILVGLVFLVCGVSALFDLRTLEIILGELRE